MLKLFFGEYLRQKWIDLRQIKTSMINSPLYAYLGTHFTSEKCFVSW